MRVQLSNRQSPMRCPCWPRKRQASDCPAQRRSSKPRTCEPDNDRMWHSGLGSCCLSEAASHRRFVASTHVEADRGGLGRVGTMDRAGRRPAPRPRFRSNRRRSAPGDVVVPAAGVADGGAPVGGDGDIRIVRDVAAVDVDAATEVLPTPIDVAHIAAAIDIADRDDAAVRARVGDAAIARAGGPPLPLRRTTRRRRCCSRSNRGRSRSGCRRTCSSCNRRRGRTRSRHRRAAHRRRALITVAAGIAGPTLPRPGAAPRAARSRAASNRRATAEESTRRPFAASGTPRQPPDPRIEPKIVHATAPFRSCRRARCECQRPRRSRHA